MPDEGFYVATDTDVLRMENELLALENRLLRGRQADADRDDTQRTRDSDELANSKKTVAALEASRDTEKQRTAALEQRLAEAQPRADRLDEVENDLRWVLGRLSHSPFGWIFRARAGFRALVEKYL